MSLRKLRRGPRHTPKPAVRLTYSNTRRCWFTARKRRLARRGRYTLALHEPLTLRTLYI